MITLTSTSTSVSLNSPRTLAVNTTKNISLLKFAGGTEALMDKGKGGEFIVINGTEITNVDEKMKWINFIMDNKEEVLVGGLFLDYKGMSYFGKQTDGSISATITNTLTGTRFQSSVSGRLKSIVARLVYSSGSPVVTCGVYELVGSTYHLKSITEEKEITSTDWHTFNVLGNVNIATGTWYALIAFGGVATVTLRRDALGGHVSWFISRTYSLGFPDTLPASNSTHERAIYGIVESGDTLDDHYLISDLSFSRNAGEPCSYNWNISLERKYPSVLI